MSFTYSQLKTAIQDYTENNETTFVTNLPIFIRLAEERILKSVQLSLFRKNAIATITQGSQYFACPSDFLAPFSLSFRSTDENKVFVDFKDPSFLQTYTPNSSTQSVPKYYSIFDIENFLIAPTPDASYTGELHYYYRPVSLTDGADSGTTWLSINAELSLLYGSLIEAYTFMKGEQDVMAMYNQKFQESLMGIKMLGEAKEVTDEFRTGKIIRQKQ
jgi:hypothetical protein|tara:strand:+ start:63 stop:713 length:651 start_codon:yes stop_codon:yes gene_type:complete